MNKKEYTRLLHVFVFVLVCYGLSMALGNPRQETLALKYGHATGGAYLGYWLDRWLFRVRITQDSGAVEQVRRAIVVAATMWVVGGGL